ncbi:MAG: ATP-binding cassette domain-containing protein [Leptonema sp. (in: bacteria)]
MLKLKNFSRFYGYKKVINNIDLVLKPNEILCIMGPNGAGKTTLMEGILSHNRHEKSKIFFLDKEINSLQDHYQFLENVSYLGHEPGLFLDLTLTENLRFFLDLYRLKREVFTRSEIDELLHQTNLFHRKDDLVRNFSRGMRQRAGLIRCIITKPLLLILDEPLTGLDEFSIKFLVGFLKEYKKKGSCILATHNNQVFQNVIDRTIYLNYGRIEKFF